MIAYINYPQPEISLHKNESCQQVKKNRKENQRKIELDIDSISVELKKFADRKHNFDSTSSNNDMWIELDFGDLEFTRSVLDYIRKLLAKRYKPFDRIEIKCRCRCNDS